MTDNRYEYKRKTLEGNESKYIAIPMSIILNNELDFKRVAMLSYFRMHCGLNNIIGFTIPDLVEWCGGKSDRGMNGINNRFLTIMDTLSDIGYLTYLSKQSRSSYMKCELNMEYYNQECLNGYSVVYLDEIKKIMEYEKDNTKYISLNNTAILLVFAYLRNKINRRPNELKPEERSSEKVEERRKRCPEAYNTNIIDIANDLGISAKTVSKAIDILECELKLIITERAYRIKYKNDKFITLPTIFANTYKREDKYLLITDDNYSRTEIELKVENIKPYYQDYKINKRKRKEGDNDEL